MHRCREQGAQGHGSCVLEGHNNARHPHLVSVLGVGKLLSIVVASLACPMVLLLPFTLCQLSRESVSDHPKTTLSLHAVLLTVIDRWTFAVQSKQPMLVECVW
jgi:hypothetical protein